MKYVYRINGSSNSGKPAIHFHCSDCGLLDFHLTGSLYSAQLEHDPRADIDAAAIEFTARLNAGDTTLFKKESTSRKIVKSLCHCDPDVIDLEHHRAVQRARRIRDCGIALMAASGPDDED